MIDLVEMKALVLGFGRQGCRVEEFSTSRRRSPTTSVSPCRAIARILADIAKYRTELVDTCLEMDDAAMEAYLEGNDAFGRDPARLPAQGHDHLARSPRSCAVRRTRTRACQQVLDAVVDYLPAPTDVAAIKTVDADGNPIGERICSDDEPFSALAFKVINDAYGALTFIRVYSGVLTKGMSITNTTRGKREKIGRMVEMFAKEANADRRSPRR
jgi:elongation factor G